MAKRSRRETEPIAAPRIFEAVPETARSLQFERKIMLLQQALQSGRHFLREATAFTEGPLPVARTLRNGLSIAGGFAALALLGQLEAAVICAVFINQLVFVDQLSPVRERLWVVSIAALCFAAAGAVGGLIAGSEPVILVATFAFGTFAGLVHGSLPGIELIPRNALICMIVGAYLPHIGGEAALGAAAGALLAVLGAYCEHKVEPNVRGIALANAREVVTYQAPRFVTVYGIAAVAGMALGALIGDVKPYWVTITTLVVLQPGRRANTLRATQRFLGTMTGVVIAYLIARACAGPWQRDCLAAFALITPFLWPLAFARNYGLGVAVLSFWILILLDLAAPPAGNAAGLFMARLVDTAIGCVIALAANLLIEEGEKENAAADSER